jgi:hypothetical protein
LEQTPEDRRENNAAKDGEDDAGPGQQLVGSLSGSEDSQSIPDNCLSGVDGVDDLFAPSLGTIDSALIDPGGDAGGTQALDELQDLRAIQAE